MNATLQTIITDTIRQNIADEETISITAIGFGFDAVLLALEVASERFGFFGGVWHGRTDKSVVSFADNDGSWAVDVRIA